MIREATLTRFISSRSDFRPSDMAVKPRAFQPFGGETSVFIINELGENETWDLAVSHVEPSRGRVLARGDVRSEIIGAVGLEVSDDPPPFRHALITGWPDDKAKQISLSQEIAAAANLVLRP